MVRVAVSGLSLVIIFILFLVVIGAQSYWLYRTQNKISHLEDELSQKSADFPYLSKRIFADNPSDIIINFTPLRSSLKDYVVKNGVEEALYFEYLPSGISIGIDQDRVFALASLMKVPVVMAVYKQIEEGKLKKDQELTVSAKNLDRAFGDLWQKGEGAKITVEEAIVLALTKSDNTAIKVLQDQLAEDSVADVFDYFDLPQGVVLDIPVQSTRGFASIFKSLFLSSYLSKRSSHEILDYLTKSSFNDGLPSGVGGNVAVAHKIGVYIPNSSQSTKIHSDCGIIYVPNRPYFLCVAVGAEIGHVNEVIAEFSKRVYDYVSSVNRQ